MNFLRSLSFIPCRRWLKIALSISELHQRYRVRFRFQTNTTRILIASVSRSLQVIVRLTCLMDAPTWITNVTIELFPKFFGIFLTKLILGVDRDWRVRQSSSALACVIIVCRRFWNAGTGMSRKVLRVRWPAIFFFLSSWNKLTSLYAVQTWVHVLAITHKWITMQMTSLVRLNTYLEWQMIVVQNFLSLSVSICPYEGVVYGMIEVRHIYFKFHN